MTEHIRKIHLDKCLQILFLLMEDGPGDSHWGEKIEYVLTLIIWMLLLSTPRQSSFICSCKRQIQLQFHDTCFYANVNKYVNFCIFYLTVQSNFYTFSTPLDL